MRKGKKVKLIYNYNAHPYIIIKLEGKNAQIQNVKLLYNYNANSYIKLQGENVEMQKKVNSFIIIRHIDILSYKEKCTNAKKVKLI